MKILEHKRPHAKKLTVNHAYFIDKNETKWNEEFYQTVCGIGFTVNVESVKELYGKITCPYCIRMIKFCKSIDSRNLQEGVGP